METNQAMHFGSLLVIALIVYGVAAQLLFWRVPRHRHFVPGLVVSASGALVASLVVAQFWPETPLFGHLFAGALGSLGFVFAAVKVGTPASVTITIDTAIDSGHLDAFRAEGYEPPFAWPYHFAVEKYGTVIWELRGAEGTKVEIEFPADNSPFGNDRNGKPRSVFKGVVPGRIIASPTIRPSAGSYVIKKTTPEGAEVLGDPSWSIPRRKA